MIKKLLRPSNRRTRLFVGLLLAGLFCIQCTRKTIAVQESRYVVAIDGKLVDGSSDELLQTLEKMARTDHIGLLEYCLKNYEEKYTDYTCTLIKQEIIRGTTKPEQHMAVKFKDAPFSVAMAWTKNAPIGDRVLYVEGKYDDQMLVRPASPLLRALAGSVKRKPDGPDAMKNTLRPVNLFGFKRGMENLLNVYRQAEANGELKQEFGGYMEVAGRKTICLVRFLPAKNDYPAYRTETFIDIETLVPVCVKGYDWDEKLTSRYIYKDIEFNVGLSDEDFTPKANEMPKP